MKESVITNYNAFYFPLALLNSTGVNSQNMNFNASYSPLIRHHDRQPMSDEHCLINRENFHKVRHLQIADYLAHCLEMTSLFIQGQHLDLGLSIDQSISRLNRFLYRRKSRVCRIARGVASNAKLQKVCVNTCTLYL